MRPNRVVPLRNRFKAPVISIVYDDETFRRATTRSRTEVYCVMAGDQPMGLAPPPPPRPPMPETAPDTRLRMAVEVTLPLNNASLDACRRYLPPRSPIGRYPALPRSITHEPTTKGLPAVVGELVPAISRFRPYHELDPGSCGSAWLHRHQQPLRLRDL
jgi:hypothetical protein